jgi:Family of unknown function (DUF6151)
MTGSARDIPLRCRCGHVRGIASEVAPYGGFRFICYCQDCQAFARLLERQDVLDSGGGTDIFQMPTGRMKLTGGQGRPALPAILPPGLSLVHRLLPNADWEHRRPALSDDRCHSFVDAP